MRLGVAQKLWLSILLLISMILLPVAFALDRAVVQFYHEQNAQEMLGIGRRLADLIARSPVSGSEEAILIIAGLVGAPALVLDDQGIVTAGSGPLQEQIGRRIDTPQVASMLQGDAAIDLALDQSIPGRLFVASTPIVRDGAVVGGVLLFRSAAEVDQALDKFRLLFAGAGAALFVLLLSFGWVLSRRLVRPLLSMRDAAERLARGSYETRVRVGGDDELQELAQTINHLGESLETLEKGRRSFFANVSHELRTPLSYLQGYSDALAQGLAEDEHDVREYGRIISEESRRLSRLVNDLFELARSDEGRLSLKAEPVDVAAVAGRVVGRSAPKGKSQGIAIACETDPDAVAIGDPDRIDQVIVNLVDNAIAHTPAGGRILVTVRVRDEVIVAVEDSGPGLRGEEDRIWERFYRGADVAGEGFGRKGAGLGLAIVKSLVESQGGAVFAGNGERLGGAKVGFSLPKH